MQTAFFMFWEADMDKNIEISLLFDFYGQLLSGKQRQAVSLYYNDDLSLSETSEVMGITRQGVRDLVRRSESELYEYERKLGLYERFSRTGESAALIKQIAGSIGDTDDERVRNAVERIIDLADRMYEQEA